MSLEGTIAQLEADVEDEFNAGDLPSERRSKLRLYLEGVKQKVTQAEFALNELDNLSLDYDNPGEDIIRQQVHFYCDAFWTFLYSALDVLGQVINQTQQLGLEEKRVDFKNVSRKLNNSTTPHPLGIHFQTCLNTHAFKALEKYRHCSMHRRHVYFKEMYVTETTGSAGYSIDTTSALKQVERYLCDDPSEYSPDKVPTVSKRRQIPDYLGKVHARIVRAMDEILMNVTI